MSVDNKSNYGSESYDVSLYYEAEQDDYYYYVSRVDDQYTFTRWDNGYYIPPGKVGTAFQVICVEDACKEITIIYKNYKTDEEKRIPVNL